MRSLLVTEWFVTLLKIYRTFIVWDRLVKITLLPLFLLIGDMGALLLTY